MSLEIHSVINASTSKDEAVILHAKEAVNLKDYAVVDRTFEQDGSLSNEFRHIYFFPNKPLKKGEWVALRSGIGTNGGTGKFSDGDEYHEFFWQSKACIWNDEGGDRATLIKFSSVSSATVPPVKKK